MKIVLIAPGYKPFPPNGWGAVESIVWDYYENLKKRNISVEIVNHADPNLIIQECNLHDPSVVHIMYDDYIIVAPYLKCKNIFYTSHYAYITHPEFENKYNHYFMNIFQKVINYSDRIRLNVISKDIKDKYVEYGFPESKINILHNGAREDLFKYTETPSKKTKSIYLAKVEHRKCQYKYQMLPDIDFVGNYANSEFDTTNPNYHGEWDKHTLYEKLTGYANLVLLSEGEADPLVVKEALLCGLGVVISECSSANLDISRDFITIIPTNKLNDLVYVNDAIIKNRIVSIANRAEIRQYGLDNFAWDKIINKYLETI